MEFNPIEFVNSLPYMGWGMLGILIVMGVIIAVTAILNLVIKDKPADRSDG